MGPARWFDGNNAVPTTASGNNPYTRDNVPSPLIIPLFDATHAGTYGCDSDGNTPRVTIELAISGMCNYNVLPTEYIMFYMQLLLKKTM